MLKVTDFDFYLPEELIAQTPLASRDKSRLLVLSRESGSMSHEIFSSLPDFLQPGDLLVLNNTKVLPARLHGQRPTGGSVEILLLTPLSDNSWSALVKPARRLKAGSSIIFPAGLKAEVTEEGEEGIRNLRFNLLGREFEEKLAQIGQIPLPPYIRCKLSDPDRYQTVYAQRPGAVAAPTAGLHFTPEVFQTLESKGIERAYVTLHVGLGTFRPVSAEKVEEHKMHSEFYEVTPEAAMLINNTKNRGGRVVAVGTTSVRVLESASDEQGFISPGTGSTDIFIYPGYRFKAVDALITNFHLPKSSLIMLVSALANREQILTAYREAVEKRYRFFSFGDAMLIL